MTTWHHGNGSPHRVSPVHHRWRSAALSLQARARWLVRSGLVLLVFAICLPSIAVAEPTVKEMVDALATQKAAEPSPGQPRMRGLRIAKPEATGGRLQLSVQFEFASATITPESRDLLAKLALAMTSSELTSKRFRIEGHTDASGDPQANLQLSERRAQSVRRYLTDAGRIDANRLVAVGKGSAEPVDGSASTAPINRRVVIVALDDATPGTGAPAAGDSTQSPAPAPASVIAGSVLKVQGSVSATRADAAVPLSPGEAVKEGDIITTSSDDSVLVQLADGAKLLVRPNTRVSLTQIVNAGETDKLGHIINLAIGAIRYVTGSVGKLRPQGVRFKTPSATIGIRGTDIEIVHAPKMRSLESSGTYVRVNTGAIELDGIDGSKVVLSVNEQAFAGQPGPKMRGGARAPAARKLDAPASVFSGSELDALINPK
jgi:outer membrane protein OmpA-like peptidoglycan-associated protein